MARTTRKRAKTGAAVRYAFYFATLAAVLAWPAISLLYLNGSITLNAANADATITLEMLFPLMVFSYMLAKGHNLDDIVRGLGLSRDKINVRNIVLGLVLFGLILLTGFLIGAFSEVTGIQLPTNVQRVLYGMPAYFLVFTFVVAPFDEEILFRGFLVPKIGIIASSIIFAIPHLLTYQLSVSELVAALVFGLLAGYVFKRYKSLYATVLAHALVNLVTILALFPL